jgi:ABC-type uncharacterized transport system substrate-binding protein
VGIVIKQNLALFLLAVSFFTPSISKNNPAGQEEAAPIKVAVVMNERRPEYVTAVKGMEASLQDRVEVYDLKNQENKASKALATLRERKPDLIIALGASAYQAVKSQEWDIPVMFSMVAYPDTYTKGGEMPFGISLHLDPYMEMKFIRDLCGESVKVGIIYNPEISRKMVERRITSAKVFKIEVIAHPAADEKTALEAVDKLKDEVDIFLLIPDPVMVNEKVFDRLKLEGFRRNKPIIGFSEDNLSENCLAYVRPDFEALGRLTGEKAAYLIKMDKASGIIYPREFKVGISRKVAERLDFKIPKTILKLLKTDDEVKE